MFFNSIDFAIFLPIVFILYWFVFNQTLKFQNSLIVLASYIFYGWWDWRFLSLILFSTLLDYTIGLKLKSQKNEGKRKLLLWTSILVNLGFLTFFKYYNFFLDNFIEAFSFFGAEFKASSLSIILPVGISFYTFQTLSYTIDVYRKKLEPTRNFIAFMAFVSFFPQLVAGPIERATKLLPQFYNPRKFEYSKAVDGMRQILWGLFKKVVIADNCAELANHIFNNSMEMNGSTLVIGTVLFTFQIYCDFSGYSDIAIGVARLFGFDLMKNFAFPYFSRDIAEFWRRWHISLSTWFRDYLYIPLGGSRVKTMKKVRNIFIVFIVSGFWHGANWTFIIWGTLNALYFLPLLLTNNNRKNMDTVANGMMLPTLREFISIISTFILVSFSWIFFRAESMQHAINIISSIFSETLFNFPIITDPLQFSIIVILLIYFIFQEWIGRNWNFAIEKLGFNWHRSLRWSLYLALFILVFLLGGNEQDFIYFQF